MKLAIHTRSGNLITAPFEAWVVAIVNTMAPAQQSELFANVARMEGASLIPDKYQFISDELGTATFVERPTLDLSGRM